MAYDTKTLNKIFAVLSVALLLVVVWMALDDYIRPWKAIQVKAVDIEKQKLQAKIKEIDGSLDANAMKEIKDKIAAAEKGLESHQANIDKINDKINDVAKQVYVQNMTNGVNGSQAAAYQFQYEHALMEKHDDHAKKYKVKFDDFKKKNLKGRISLRVFKPKILNIKMS